MKLEEQATKGGPVKVGTVSLIVAGGFVRQMDIKGSWWGLLYVTNGKMREEEDKFCREMGVQHSQVIAAEAEIPNEIKSMVMYQSCCS